MYPTAEQISQAADHLEGLANRRAIFRAYRAQDDSHLWPINGRFNATNRAIRRLRKFESHYGAMYGYELCLCLEQEIRLIVNAQ